MRRTFLTGASLVLADRIVNGQTLVLEDGRIVEISSGPRSVSPGEARVDLNGCVVGPGFIDVHVHGAAGTDVMDGAGAIAALARLLPRWGVTAFCPTSIACPPEALSAFLAEVGRARAAPETPAARVLPAHLESNFISPEFRGAQPASCLRLPSATSAEGGDFSGADILAAIDRHKADVGVITLAPEIDGGLALTRSLVSAGVAVSVGHSGASFEEGEAAIAAGARRATHLFNRMRPMRHRDPGLAGAVLAADEVAAELICDGCHVHPAVMRVAVASKQPSRVLAITDGTAGSGLPAGSRARLGGQPITVGDVASLDDGTIAGSVATMDRVFRCLVGDCGFDLVQAAHMTSTSPARELGLVGHGVIAAGSAADLVVLDSKLQVVSTWIGGVRVFSGTMEAGSLDPA
jgi:N-acetylglucosamine-6-phosphate deacetylase